MVNCKVCFQPKETHEVLEKKKPSAPDLCIKCFANMVVAAYVAVIDFEKARGQ